MVGAGRAGAEALPDVTHCPSCSTPESGARVIDLFEEMARRGGATAPAFTPPDVAPSSPPFDWAAQAADDFAALEARQAAGTAGARAVAGETLSAGRLAGVLPKVPTVYAAAGAFVAGYAIGYGLNQLFFHIDTPSAPPASTYGDNPRLLPVDKGDLLFSSPLGVPVYAPEPGWIYTWYQGAPVYADRVTDNYSDGVEGACEQPAGPGVGVAIDSEAAENGCAAASLPYPPWTSYRPIVKRGYFLAQSKLDAGLDVPLRGKADGDAGTNIGSASDPGRSALAAALPDVLNANPTLAQWIESRLNPAAPDPTAPPHIAATSCDGLLYAACVARLRELGFTGDITRAVEPFAKVKLLLRPNEVTSPVRTVPYSPDSVPEEFFLDDDDEVEVRTNPAPDEFPVAVPPPEHGDGGEHPPQNETFESYRSRLAAAGLLGFILLLDADTLDPDQGPGRVSGRNPVRVRPGFSTRVFGGTRYVEPGAELDVPTNPDTAPEPIPGGVGGGCGPTVPAVDLSPLNQDVGGKFPFGIFAWLLGALGGWTGGGDAPRIVIPIHGDDLVVDFAQLEPAMEVVRPVILILSLLSLGWLFASSALGFGSSAANED